MDSVIKDLEAKIERLQATIERTAKITNKPTQTPGAFVTGRSGRSRSLDRQLDRENNRKADAFVIQQQAVKDLAFTKQRLALYKAGEVHANGQPRADAPSKQRAADMRSQVNACIRSLIRPGGLVAESWGSTRVLRVKRVNAKSITTELGVKWTFDEIVPTSDSGGGMTQREFTEAFKAWKATQND